MTANYADTLIASIKMQDASIAAMRERRARSVELLVKELGNTSGTYSGPSGSVTLSENNTYPPSAMEAQLRPGQLQRVRSSKTDPAKVKALYPNVYASAKVTNGFKATVR